MFLKLSLNPSALHPKSEKLTASEMLAAAFAQARNQEVACRGCMAIYEITYCTLLYPINCKHLQLAIAAHMLG
jgi:hypothetical protein